MPTRQYTIVFEYEAGGTDRASICAKNVQEAVRLFRAQHKDRYLISIEPVGYDETPTLLRPPPEIADTAKVRLGDGFISAEFPPLPAKVA